jgi:multidrug efflux pump subunit AcrB
MYLGFAGNVAKYFLNSKITPLIVSFTILLGVFAVFKTSREEEPQIKVPMIDVYIPVPGYEPKLVENKVTTPVEKELSGLYGVKHLYSTSMEGASFITVRFEVGEDMETSLIKVHDKLMALKYILPTEAMQPVVKSYTIDDVPFYAVTFYSDNLSSYQIRRSVVPVAKSLQAIDGVSNVDIIGGQRMVAKITPDLAKLSSYGITLLEMKQAVESSSSQFTVAPLRVRTPESIVAVGSFISSIQDLKDIPIGRRFGRTIKMADVTTVEFAADEVISRVLYGKQLKEAVTVTFTKKKGVNATALSKKIEDKLLQGYPLLSKDNIKWETTRDYGATAGEKSNELIKHLIIATLAVVLLIALMMGWKISLVVGVTVPVTLAVTLLMEYLIGYTLNRVTLFALIFSIGILVDDAIVVVENIYRHLSLGIHSAKDVAITAAVDEVGNPTILATFTVILAIMPLAFVGGMMGPYMRPIPIGASIAMIFSMFIAFIVSPWAAKKIITDKDIEKHKEAEHNNIAITYLKKLMDWMLLSKKNTYKGVALVSILLVASIFMIFGKAVKVKMLPFDNKSEFQILIDMPPGTTLDQTKDLTQNIVNKIYGYKEVKNTQVYIGTAAPFGFSGMVKHTFLRKNSYMADIQVNLLDKSERSLQSHELVKKMRNDMNSIFKISGLKLKFLEVPPGPPVMSTVLAEVYHPDEKKQYELLKKVESVYRGTEGVVDIDTTLLPKQEKLFFNFDRAKGAVYGIPESYSTNTVMMALGNLDMFSVDLPNEEEPIFMRMSLLDKDKNSDAALMSLLVPSLEGDKHPLSNFMKLEKKETQNPIQHKDLQRVMYVMGELSGKEESPIYAIDKMESQLKEFKILYAASPTLIDRPILKWDGEMDITVEVFRDLGIAFLIAIILIMVLVIGWYNSFTIPFILMLPVPLSLIGIVFGHWVMGAFFTATSMIGFIAMAGITVRNSILLIDFIEQKRFHGSDCKDAVVEAAVVRFRPILLTALAVIVAAVVILFDPIFQGLAISLMMGSIASAVLSIPLVPILYYWMRKNHVVKRKSHAEVCKI